MSDYNNDYDTVYQERENTNLERAKETSNNFKTGARQALGLWGSILEFAVSLTKVSNLFNNKNN